MKNSFLILLISLFALNLQAQSYEDSLRNVINNYEDKAEVKEALFLLGEHLVQLNPEEAESHAQRLSNMPDVPKDSIEWGRLNYIFAASHRWQGNYKTALEFYNLNYDFFKRKDDQKNIAKTGRFLGLINMYLGNNVLSQKYLLEVADIYNEIGTPKQKASISNSLASFYLNIDQKQKGLERYQDAFEQYKAMNDSSGMATTSANMGYIFTELGQFEKAEEYLLTMKELSDVFPTKRELGFYHDFMGLLRQEQGRLQDAYKEHLTALRIREGLSSTYNLCESKLNLGGVLIKLERFDEAINQLEDVLSYEEHESFNQESIAHELLSVAYEAKKDYASALRHFKDYKAVSDTLYNKESIQIIAEKDAAFKKKEQDAEIALLEKENEVAQAKLSRSRLIIFGSLAALIIFSLISFFVYRLYRKIKNQNEIISKTLNDKNLLLKEIHHRVKNNLQVISSLLNLQSKYVTDQSALEAIKDGRARVRSMAILHQNLYREGDVTTVNMKEYFSNLVHEIFESYNLNDDKVNLDLDIEDVNIDVDTVIPIGLIANELITNSLKYAFNETTKDATIAVKLKEGSDEYELVVKDNGIGIADEILNRKPSQSFGQRIINAFIIKLKAKMQIHNEQGTEVVINIPKLKQSA